MVVVPHTDLTEVTRMVLVEVDAHVVLTTSLTTTSRMLPVLSNTTMTSRDVASQLSGFLQFGCLEKRRSENRPNHSNLNPTPYASHAPDKKHKKTNTHHTQHLHTHSYTNNQNPVPFCGEQKRERSSFKEKKLQNSTFGTRTHQSLSLLFERKSKQHALHTF